jgi:simple sugar transport system substrate-binding protein
MRGARTKWRLAAGLAAATLALAACSSGGGSQEEEGGSDAGSGGQVASNERFTVAMVTHEAPGDSFWDKIRNGAQAAADKDNIELVYSNDNTGPGQATKIQQAIDSDIDGLAVTMAFTDAVRPAIEAAVEAGIPVVGFNQGIDQYKEYGALMYFGSDEALAGESAGRRITEAGGSKVLCVIQEQGSVALETRCAGVKVGAPNTENINVNGTDIASVTSTITAKLQEDTSIDYIVTLGAPIALAALDSIGQASSQAKLVTFDLNAEAAAAIQNGQIEFSIDQQPYVQGYEAVDSLWLYLTNRNDMGGGLPVLTGPSFVDADNIEAIVPFTANNTR